MVKPLTLHLIFWNNNLKEKKNATQNEENENTY